MSKIQYPNKVFLNSTKNGFIDLRYLTHSQRQDYDMCIFTIKSNCYFDMTYRDCEEHLGFDGKKFHTSMDNLYYE